MPRTVHELRNEIRVTVGRFERETSTTFTKEDLAAICEAVGYPIDETGRLPPKATMRAGVLSRIADGEAADDPESVDRPFRKEELEDIIAAIASD